ncbi:hypothetical protein YC2023_102070 [Brassica napus]
MRLGNGRCVSVYDSCNAWCSSGEKMVMHLSSGEEIKTDDLHVSRPNIPA